MIVRRVKQKTVVGQVMNQIKQLIASGQLKPHDRMPTEVELARMFGTGRSSIREAIKIFQHLGIVETRTRLGTFVCPSSNISTEALTWAILLGKDDIFELLELRKIIEQEALQNPTLNFGRRTREAVAHVESLKAELSRVEEAAKSLRLETLYQSDYSFHGAIIASSKNSLFTNIYATLRSFLLEEMKKTNVLKSQRQAMVREHRAILAGILSRNPKRALPSVSPGISRTRVGSCGARWHEYKLPRWKHREYARVPLEKRSIAGNSAAKGRPPRIVLTCP